MSKPVHQITEHIRSTVESLLRARWIESPGVLRTPIQFPNVAGLVNKDGTMMSLPPQQAPWIKLDIGWGDGRAATLGTPALNELRGVIYLSIFVPQGTGTATLELLKGHARQIFSRYHGGLSTPVNDLRCLVTDPGSRAEQDGAWIYSVLATPFYTFEFVTANP